MIAKYKLGFLYTPRPPIMYMQVWGKHWKHLPKPFHQRELQESCGWKCAAKSVHQKGSIAFKSGDLASRGEGDESLKTN